MTVDCLSVGRLEAAREVDGVVRVEGLLSSVSSVAEDATVKDIQTTKPLVHSPPETTCRHKKTQKAAMKG